MNSSVRSMAMVAALVAAFTPLRPASAQSSGDGFRFQPPSGSFSLRAGYAMPSANSDLFSFTTSNLTLSRGDFDALDLGGDLSFTLNPRLDLVFDFAYSGMNKGSESRGYTEVVGSDSGVPIRQTTALQRTSLTVNARYYLTDRGRQVGRFAWIPNRIAPYVGAGLGAMNYGFTQKGDFVDDNTLAIFTDRFHSGGWTAMAQALAGAELSLGPGWALRGEARYLTASAAPGSDFVGFHRIDLSGVSTSVGFFVRF